MHTIKQLSTKNLSLGYNAAPIVDDLNVAIPVGKITVLVGPNGCGKSTLLRGLARLLKPRAGKVYLNNKSLFQLSAKEVAGELGILTQGPVAPFRFNSQRLGSFWSLSLSKLVAAVVKRRSADSRGGASNYRDEKAGRFGFR